MLKHECNVKEAPILQSPVTDGPFVQQTNFMKAKAITILIRRATLGEYYRAVNTKGIQMDPITYSLCLSFFNETLNFYSFAFQYLAVLIVMLQMI